MYHDDFRSSFVAVVVQKWKENEYMLDGIMKCTKLLQFLVKEKEIKKRKYWNRGTL